MTMKLSTPISDPAVIAGVKGKIDLSKLQQAMPLDSISLNGLIRRIPCPGRKDVYAGK